MANCARRSAAGALEQMTMLGDGASATPGETCRFYTALEECSSSGHNLAIGDSTNAGSSMERKSEYFSPRVEEMMQSKSLFSSEVEHEIEHSKVHWSEVLGVSELSEYSTDHEEVNVENEKAFAELANDPQWNHDRFGHFFRELSFSWKLGQKIAEGGQAAIFEIMKNHQTTYGDIVLKVFKRGSCLSDLKKQWPTGILRRDLGTCITWGGFLLEDGRFAFIMSRCWGDLRMLIDQAMQEKNNRGPPFPYEWKGWTWHVSKIMLKVATDMAKLHKHGIIHKDLKAANVLLSKGSSYKTIFVADYECSIGVVGTGFWRAPEILLALKNRTSIDFNDKVDVYSFGMTCFEVVTGRLPFEGELDACRASYDLVIEGQRPKLPSDLGVHWKDLIERCWNSIPSERPSFEEIWHVLYALSSNGM